MTEAEISVRLLGFIKEALLGDDPASDLDDKTPLLEWGVLNSMNTAMLLAFIREQLGYDIPPTAITARNFRDVRAICAMLADGLVSGKAQG